MMRAAVYKGAKAPLSIEDISMPVAGPGELVFKVGACGVCASDLHAAEVGLVPAGVVFGHEYAGEVVEVGPGVSGWAQGDRLCALAGFRPCGSCGACRAGRPGDCANRMIQGFHPAFPGAYAQYSVVPANRALKLPDSVALPDAATMEPLAVGLNAWKTAAVPSGASVLIVGAGIIGLAVAKWARFFGAADAGVSEVVPARLQRAREMGVDVVIDAGACPDPVVEFERQTGRGPSVIFECVGRPIVGKLIEMAPPHAHLVLVGTGMQNEQFTVLSAALKRLRMTFAFGTDPNDFPFVLRTLASGRIAAQGLVTASVGLDELPAMFASLQKPNANCKVLVTP